MKRNRPSQCQLFFSCHDGDCSIHLDKIYKSVFVDCEDCGENPLLKTVQTGVASTINAVSIVILDAIYKRVAVKLNDWENHRTQSEYDSALILKSFMFMFVNNNAVVFYAAFWLQDLNRLFAQVCSVMLVKQFTNIFKASVLPILKTKKRLRKVKKGLAEEWEKQQKDPSLANIVMGLEHVSNRDMHRARALVEENAALGKWKGVTGEYAELIIQYGYVTMFSCALPAASLIAMIVNVIAIRAEMLVNTHYTQRPQTRAASGIPQRGSWSFNFLGTCRF